MKILTTVKRVTDPDMKVKIKPVNVLHCLNNYICCPIMMWHGLLQTRTGVLIRKQMKPFWLC